MISSSLSSYTLKQTYMAIKGTLVANVTAYAHTPFISLCPPPPHKHCAHPNIRSERVMTNHHSWSAKYPLSDQKEFVAIRLCNALLEHILVMQLQWSKICPCWATSFYFLTDLISLNLSLISSTSVKASWSHPNDASQSLAYTLQYKVSFVSQKEFIKTKLL